MGSFPSPPSFFFGAPKLEDRRQLFPTFFFFFFLLSFPIGSRSADWLNAKFHAFLSFSSPDSRIFLSCLHDEV